MFIGSICAGLVIGVLSGLLGIGGGTVMVPLFRLAYGFNAIAATATSLFTIIPTSISGVVSHLRNKTCIPKLGLALGIGGAIASPFGVWLARISPDWLIMVAAAVVIVYSAYNMLRKALAMKSARVAAGTAGAAGASAGSAAGATVPKAAKAPEALPAAPALSLKQYAQGALIGLVAGVLSGYVGVGGGFIMVPLMLAVLNIPMKLASGTSLIAIFILAIPGTIEQGLAGNIDYLTGIAIAIGSIPGAFIGAKLIRYVPERTLRFVFAAFLAVAGILLIVKEAGLLG